MNKVYIYCLIDPRNGKPFYVGATCNPASRYSQHKTLLPGIVINKNGIEVRRRRKIQAILNSGNVLKMEILKITTPKSAAKWELHYFKLFYDEGQNLIQMAKFDRKIYSRKYFNTHQLHNFT